MKKNNTFLIASFPCLILFLLAGTSWAQTSGCVTCHTNADTLKSLHKPVVIEGGEGEG